MNILVTGARLPAALELVRALHAAGASVWAADSLAFTPAGASRDCAGYLRFPSPALKFQEFRTCMRQTVQRLKIDLIVPASEEIFYLAQIADELAPARLFAPSFADLRRLHSKWEILAMANGCAVRIPKTIRATTKIMLQTGLKEMPESVLKPEFSRGAYQARFAPHDGPGMPDALNAMDISPTNPWLIQETLRGKEISTFSVAHPGKVLAHAAYEPRWRVAHGASLYFRPLDAPAAECFVTAFVEKHRLSGQISFDLMVDDDGTVALIECNPRTTSGIHLFASPKELGRAILADDAAIACVSDKAKAAKLAIALLHGASALRAGQFRLLRSDLRVAKDSSFLMRDPLPLLSLYASSLEILLRSRSWRVDARHAYTFDLEWNG